MAEAILLPVVKTIAVTLTSFATSYVVEEFKAAKKNSDSKDLEILANHMQAICTILEDAEERRFTSKPYKLWLQDLKSVVYDIDDVLDELAYDALNHRYQSSKPLVLSSDYIQKIRGIREEVDNIVAKKDRFSLTEHPIESARDEIRNSLDGCSFVSSEQGVIGRDGAKLEILDKLIAVSDATQLSVLPIVGMGGMGKTTLAKLVYGDAQRDFDLRLWACVSNKFQISQIVEAIVKNGIGDKYTPNLDFNTLVKKLHDLLNAKYFLVLDDVWVEDIAKWNELKGLLAVGKAGSAILITTRNMMVASITQTMEPYKLERLSDEVCWTIFKQLAFTSNEETRYPKLHVIGRSIIEKCHGIPLVVETLGSLLRNERNEHKWCQINSMDGFMELDQCREKIMQLLKVSYNRLPSHLKPCFAYLSLFAKDAELCFFDVPILWSALGLLEKKGNGKYEIEDCGHSYVMELVSRSLLQEPAEEDSGIEILYPTKMHDLLHDLATYILGEELCVVTQNKLIVSKFSRHIVWGCEKAKEFPKDLHIARNIRTFRFSSEMQNISRAFLEGIISKFRSLRILDLAGSWFEELPGSIGNLKHLRYLDLSDNVNIRTLPNTISKLLYLESLNLTGCDHLKKIPKGVFKLRNLRLFGVTTCQKKLDGTGLNKLSSLYRLCICSCESLVSLWDGAPVGALSSIRVLTIDHCPKLTTFRNCMSFLVHLQQLCIVSCEELDLEEGEGLQGLQSLSLLLIAGIPKLRSLPLGIESTIPTLQHLQFHDCEGLVELPDSLQHFASLRSFKIEDCPNLLGLPKEFGHLLSLQTLVIKNCPHLSERCAELTGEDYSKIRHIPRINLDGVWFTPHHSR